MKIAQFFLFCTSYAAVTVTHSNTTVVDKIRNSTFPDFEEYLLGNFVLEIIDDTKLDLLKNTLNFVLNLKKHDINKTLESFNLTLSTFNSISNFSELVILPILIESIEFENITLPAWSLLEEAVRNVTNVALDEYPNTVASIKFIREVEIENEGIFTVLMVSVFGGIFVLLLAIIVLGVFIYNKRNTSGELQISTPPADSTGIQNPSFQPEKAKRATLEEFEITTF
ncbi:unnamed protein product [Oikopleura dioica]|uniref:SEA domain-containing protein n=1 Tax=Oikopleura dioica TaxID=34765 RepID=E4WUB8_OIKDI|nr:unnamed protein product [Oikopleura dioica]